MNHYIPPIKPAGRYSGFFITERTAAFIAYFFAGACFGTAVCLFGAQSEIDRLRGIIMDERAGQLQHDALTDYGSK